jgi:CheY-like chemotaxis protein
MSEEVLARAFDPYFTTKEVGKGTGIGLSMVQGMAAQLGGVVSINSRVFIPRASQNAVNMPLPVIAPIAKGNSRILIVEDDPAVLSFLSDALAELGYEAIAVADTETALSIVERGDPFDAVLSDFKMPGMSGIDLLARLCEMRPGLKGILVTGNVDATDPIHSSVRF